jgi:hypothetical protein
MKPLSTIAASALLCLSMAVLAPAASAQQGTPSAAATANERQTNTIVWRGEVDGTIDISLRHRSVQVNVVSGRSLRREHRDFRVQGFLPARALTTRLESVEGPGTIEVVQQPAEANNFTAVVRISNPNPGRAEFRFTLAW